MRILLLSSFISMTWYCHAANVRWGDVEFYQVAEDDRERICCEFHGAYGIFVAIQAQYAGELNYLIDITLPAGGSSQNWFIAKEGDVVDQNTMRFRNDDDYLLRHMMGDGDDIKSGIFVLQKTTSAYLAFVCSDLEYVWNESYASFVYGWIELGIDSNGMLYLAQSAYDLDGGPMVVGGGVWTGGIPEPSCGMLFLLGVAILGLRREEHNGGKSVGCSSSIHSI